MTELLIDDRYVLEWVSPAKVVTLFGIASQSKSGHFYISSKKEGNHQKGLHRLIYESENNCVIPKGYEIHHINRNPADNRIENLQMLSKSEHMSIHANTMTDIHKKRISHSKLGEKNAAYGKPHSENHRKLISKQLTSSGFFHVHKSRDTSYKKNFKWCYEYSNGEKQRVITRSDLVNLKKVVLEKGLEWEILDYDKAMDSLKEDGSLSKYIRDGSSYHESGK